MMPPHWQLERLSNRLSFFFFAHTGDILNQQDPVNLNPVARSSASKVLISR
jgi:hypothetical protein